MPSFSQAYTEYAGGGLNGCCMVLLNVDYDALHFHTGIVKNQHFQSTLLGGRDHKKEYSVYTFDNVDNSGRPLNYK